MLGKYLWNLLLFIVFALMFYFIFQKVYEIFQSQNVDPLAREIINKLM